MVCTALIIYLRAADAALVLVVSQLSICERISRAHSLVNRLLSSGKLVPVDHVLTQALLLVILGLRHLFKMLEFLPAPGMHDRVMPFAPQGVISALAFHQIAQKAFLLVIRPKL